MMIDFYLENCYSSFAWWCMPKLWGCQSCSVCVQAIEACMCCQSETTAVLLVSIYIDSMRQLHYNDSIPGSQAGDDDSL